MAAQGMRARKAAGARRALAHGRELPGRPSPPATTGEPARARSRPEQGPDRPPPPLESSSPDAGLLRTYSGLLDDVMLRYSDEYLGEAFFNKMIAKNVLFGGGMYLNDGYLINHPVARKYLRDDDSLLRVMMATNFIRLLTREGDPVALYEMPEKMARSGSTSFQDLVASAEWAALRPLYKTIAQGVFHNGNNRSWPRFDMSFGFAKLIDGIFGRPTHNLGLRLITEDQLKYIADRFAELRPREGNARHKFEVAVSDVVQGDRPRLAEMMAIANQAYHYNFGLTLTEEDTQGVAVDTTIGMAFDELLATREVQRGQLEDFPLIQIPDGLPFDDGDLFRPFLDPSTKVGQMKLAYLGALKTLLASGATQISDLRKDAREATNAYLDAIKALFTKKVGRLASETLFASPIVMGIGNLAPPGVRGADEVIASSAPTAGLAIALQSQATALKREFLVERFRLVDADADFNPSRDRIVTLGDVRPQIASLAFNPAKAKAFIADIPAIGGK